jgi:hypothetical protein
MRVNNRVTPPANHEATSRSRTPADGGRNRVWGEHQTLPNRSRASAGGPSHSGHSGGGSGGSSSHGGGKRGGGGGDHGGRGRANSHTTGCDAVVWTSLGPLPRWVLGPTTRWAPGTTQLGSHGT